MDQETRPLALVTGASTGIGYELAKTCAENGFDLVVAADEPKICDFPRACRAVCGGIICRAAGAGKGQWSCRSPGGTYIGPYINDLNLESRSVDEWQSADERNSREKISRARQAAEDLFKRAQPIADAEATGPVPNGGEPHEQEPRRQPRIFTAPPRVPPSPKAESPVAAQPMRQRAVAKHSTRTVPPSQIGRVRTLATYGMTPLQVAELYGVTVAEIDRILRSPVYAGKTR